MILSRLFLALFALALSSQSIALPHPDTDDDNNSPQFPGDQQSDDLFCSSYKDCGSSGIQYWKNLHNTLSQANPIDRTDGLQKFQQYYAVQPSQIPYGLSRIKQDLTNHGFDINLLTGWETVSKNPATGALDTINAAYDNDFDTTNGLLVANANFRKWDFQRQLPWSELMFQTWQVVSAAQPGGGPISNLRAVVRKEVENDGAKEVLRTLYTARGLSMNQGDATWYQWSEDQQPAFFYALLGTDNVKGVIWLLNDHPNAMGRKEIVDVWTRWDKKDPDFWINLGPADWRNFLNPARRRL
ncbi:MAG: hypothetical protein Q9170_002089 [Blastenia crenularia]